jgi:rhodanese-related sulfurtransferase
MTTTTVLRTPARVLAALLLTGGVALGAAACGGSDGTSASGSGTSAHAAAPVGVADFATALEAPGTTVVDVRTPAEYAAGHLAGAVNIDVQDPGFADAVGQLDPSGRYAVYCHSGNRSATAVSYLVDRGFAHVVELAGGISAWEAAGRPVTTG